MKKREEKMKKQIQRKAEKYEKTETMLLIAEMKKKQVKDEVCDLLEKILFN